MNHCERIFVVAWEYPPITSGESVVCQRTLNHSRFSYDLCCGSNKSGEERNIRVFSTGGNKYLLWPIKVLGIFLKQDKEQHYKVMMSRVMPPNGHLVGWLLKKVRPNIKWVVYFSDPVWNSPFLEFSLKKNKEHRPNWLLMKVFGLPSKWAVREGEVLVFNNERLAKYVLGSRYDRYRLKVVIAPYGHEGVHLRATTKCENGKVRITHVGQIYGNRSLKDLVAGVELLQEREPSYFRQIEIRLVGFICETEQNRIDNSPAKGAFTLVDPVPYEESIEEMYNSDLLLVIDPVFDDPKKNIYTPGKIYDYMSTGRPIICVCDADSATADVAREAGCVIVPPCEDAIFCTLLRAVKNEIKVNIENYKRYNASNGVQKLDAVLANL